MLNHKPGGDKIKARIRDGIKALQKADKFLWVNDEPTGIGSEEEKKYAGMLAKMIGLEKLLRNVRRDTQCVYSETNGKCPPIQESVYRCLGCKIK